MTAEVVTVGATAMATPVAAAAMVTVEAATVARSGWGVQDSRSNYT